MKSLLHHALRAAGLHVQRHRDALADFAAAAPDARCVADVGTLHGTVARRLLDLFPRAEVHAIEPNALEIIRHASDSERLHWHEVAIGAEDGIRWLHRSEDQPHLSSLLKPVGVETVPYDCRVVALDSLDLRPDAIKIDVQGGELAVLHGAAESLRTCQAVLCAVNFIARYEGCALYHEVAELMHCAGFQLRNFYEINSRQGQIQFADTLFVRHT